jgi:hypothetical protein
LARVQAHIAMLRAIVDVQNAIGGRAHSRVSPVPAQQEPIALPLCPQLQSGVRKEVLQESRCAAR